MKSLKKLSSTIPSEAIAGILMQEMKELGGSWKSIWLVLLVPMI